jgi:hypothetical protein
MAKRNLIIYVFNESSRLDFYKIYIQGRPHDTV